MRATKIRMLPALGLVFGLLTAALPGIATAAGATAAGEVVLLTGRGTALDPVGGGIRELAKGDPVFAGEVVNSAINSYVNIKFADGSFILLRPKTRFQIESYDFKSTAPAAPAPAPAPVVSAPRPAASPAPIAAPTLPSMGDAAAPGSRAFFKLLKGGFRAVSGLIGKVERNEYRVSTPVATIGIRGTDYLLILCDAACNADPVLQDTLPKGRAAEGGLVVGVISGGVAVLNNAGKEATLSENQYLINLPDGTQILLPFEPRFLKVDPIPNPLGMCD